MMHTSSHQAELGSDPPLHFLCQRPPCRPADRQVCALAKHKHAQAPVLWAQPQEVFHVLAVPCLCSPAAPVACSQDSVTVMAPTECLWAQQQCEHHSSELVHTACTVSVPRVPSALRHGCLTLMCNGRRPQSAAALLLSLYVLSQAHRGRQVYAAAPLRDLARSKGRCMQGCPLNTLKV